MLLFECAQSHEQQEALKARIDSLEREKHELRAQLSQQKVDKQVMQQSIQEMQL